VEKTINKTYVIPDKLDIRIKKQAEQYHCKGRGVSKKK